MPTTCGFPYRIAAPCGVEDSSAVVDEGCFKHALVVNTQGLRKLAMTARHAAAICLGVREIQKGEGVGRLDVYSKGQAGKRLLKQRPRSQRGIVRVCIASTTLVRNN